MGGAGRRAPRRTVTVVRGLPDFWRIATSGAAVIPAGARRFRRVVAGLRVGLSAIRGALPTSSQRVNSYTSASAASNATWRGWTTNGPWNCGPAPRAPMRTTTAGRLHSASSEISSQGWRRRTTMLAPDDRRTLLEALRPPPGYRLDRAIGTTYSLDLQALLLAPLAFTLFGWQDEAGRPGADPLALLEAVRSHARSDPHLLPGRPNRHPPPQPASAELPGAFGLRSTARRIGAGVFHPKVWALRFVPQVERCASQLPCLVPVAQPHFRSILGHGPGLGWRGDPTQLWLRRQPSLADFIAALPDLATRSVPAQVEQDVEVVQSELRKVSFAVPEGFREGHLPSTRSSRPAHLAVRRGCRPAAGHLPLPGGRCPGEISATGRDHVLVSRLEALEAVEPAVLARFRSIYTLDQAAED